MHIRKPRVTALILFVALLALVAAVACGGGEPLALDLPVRIEVGVMSPETIKVKQRDMVTLKIQADEAGEFHLHTYDIEMDIEAAVETDFYFVADATGRFKITYHPLGEGGEGEEDEQEEGEEGEIEVGFLEVRPR